MALLIDTDLLIDLEKQGSAVQNLLADEESAISVITVSELLHGVLRAHGATRVGATHLSSTFLPDFKQSRSRSPSLASMPRSAQLVERGEIVGAHDLWIAATAIAHGFGVATRNISHFERIPSLRVVSPTT